MTDDVLFHRLEGISHFFLWVFKTDWKSECIHLNILSTLSDYYSFFFNLWSIVFPKPAVISFLLIRDSSLLQNFLSMCLISDVNWPCIFFMWKVFIWGYFSIPPDFHLHFRFQSLRTCSGRCTLVQWMLGNLQPRSPNQTQKDFFLIFAGSVFHVLEIYQGKPIYIYFQKFSSHDVINFEHFTLCYLVFIKKRFFFPDYYFPLIWRFIY